jgi:hypothetical protein
MRGGATEPSDVQPLCVQAEINDLKISADGRAVATCAGDGYVRVWSLEPHSLGVPLATMRLEDSVVLFLDWHPLFPNVLAYVTSSSGAGVCGVWDSAGGSEPVSLYTSVSFAHAQTGLSTRALQAAAGPAAVDAKGARLDACASWAATMVESLVARFFFCLTPTITVLLGPFAADESGQIVELCPQMCNSIHQRSV